MKLFGPSGIRILHIGGDHFGLHTDEVNTMATMDAQGEVSSASSGIAVYGIYSLLVPEPQSVARLLQVPTQDPFTLP
ncbi:hypothetical protein N7U66_01780 [Lacinutrix neustonica]|uniref:Uncharacterized protein n=1 Tax=Lacinutrix neustonica TaxID=2980107 RepID=A0A9E8SDU1_9FLAO|nr:hypothetical protein [Lacinutrix neustonica]WAC02466.1 hypothetical protein N7U66_01780 [Lacinutrix neustonica]